MNKSRIAMELVRIAKMLTASENLRDLGNEFAESEYYDKMKELVNRRFSDPKYAVKYQDTGFMARDVWKFLKTDAVTSVFLKFLKNKKNYTAQEARRLLESLNGSDIVFPAKEKFMIELTRDQNWRRYIR